MNLKQKLHAKQPVLGTFVKTTHYHNTEVLARSALDVLCLDAEHAPFSRADIDSCVLAARSQQMPALVRVPNTDPSTLLNALDVGATGLVLPHICTAEQAQHVVKKCFFGNEGRGYAGSTRAAEYTTQKLPENLRVNQEQTCVIAQIEDASAIDNIEAICAVEGIDCIFVGRMDLTISLGETDAKAASVLTAVDTIVDTAHRHGKATGMFIADLSELPMWIEKGVSLFLLSSDHSFMLAGANQLKNTFQNACDSTSE